MATKLLLTREQLIAILDYMDTWEVEALLMDKKTFTKDMRSFIPDDGEIHRVLEYPPYGYIC